MLVRTEEQFREKIRNFVTENMDDALDSLHPFQFIEDGNPAISSDADRLYTATLELGLAFATSANLSDRASANIVDEIYKEVAQQKAPLFQLLLPK